VENYYTQNSKSKPYLFELTLPKSLEKISRPLIVCQQNWHNNAKQQISNKKNQNKYNCGALTTEIIKKQINRWSQTELNKQKEKNTTKEAKTW